MTCRFARLSVLLLLLCDRVSPGAVIYGVQENPGNAVGAWDVNIMADDVHFEKASVISQISLRLSIKGNQTCKLWIFTATNSLPIHTVSFTNVPSIDPVGVTTYDFNMQLLVPKDIYVGFSAQGDGWTNNADFWSVGAGVDLGVAGTAGLFYYGPVAGEKLTTVFSATAGSFGCLQVISEPAQITSVAVKTGHVHLAIASLSPAITSIVERCDSASGTNWQEVATLPLGAASQTWSASNNAAVAAFYRIKNR